MVPTPGTYNFKNVHDDLHFYYRIVTSMLIEMQLFEKFKRWSLRKLVKDHLKVSKILGHSDPCKDPREIRLAKPQVTERRKERMKIDPETHVILTSIVIILG